MRFSKWLAPLALALGISSAQAQTWTQLPWGVNKSGSWALGYNIGGVWYTLAASCSSKNWFSSINSTGQFVCSQPQASDLSNGTTGTGAVVLASNPSIVKTGNIVATSSDTATANITSAGGTLAVTQASDGTGAVTNAVASKPINYVVQSGGSHAFYVNGVLIGSVTSSGISFSAATLTAPLPIASGGTGTASPALVAGSGISITGSWPNQTVAATGAGGWVQVGSINTVTNAASISDTTSLTNSYKRYIIHLDDCQPITTNAQLTLTLFVNGSYQSASYAYQGTYSDGGGVGGFGSASAAGITLLNSTNLQSGANYGMEGDLIISNPSATGVYKKVRWELATLSGTSSRPATYYGVGGYVGGLQALTGWKITASTGNITCTATTLGQN